MWGRESLNSLGPWGGRDAIKRLKAMMGLTRRLGAAVAVLAVCAAGPVAAQENLDKGKTPAQLYASDCAICHKSPRGLAKGVARYGLDNFLRAHYTASREAAAAISAYLQSIDRQPASGRERNSKRKAKASKPTLPARKPPEGKSSETKSSETKASDTKPAESNPSQSNTKATASEHEEAKTSAPKASGAKPVEPKPAASQPADAKAEAAKADPPKPAQDSKDSKDTKPDKSD
jgi:mono/diheme cytochrome c family protein